MSEKRRMEDLVEYQTGAIVSKILVEGEGGGITLFAFDTGQGLSEHTAPYDAMVYVLEGNAEVTISGKSHTLEEGEYIVMPANIPHSVKALSKFKMMLVMIKP